MLRWQPAICDITVKRKEKPHSIQAWETFSFLLEPKSHSFLPHCNTDEGYLTRHVKK